jgi:alpha-L-fucosidase
MKKIIATISMVLFVVQASKAQIVRPSPPQLQWHDMEFYLFAHFGPNTFTDLEWGEGTEKEEVFNPTELDCVQWCRIAKQAGAKGIIITAKHHDGFCLWPSKYSTHTVRQSKWRDGNGDVLKELSAACKATGLRFGVYISPWDRNHPSYGTAEYNNVFVNMMTELFTNYGPIWELWWDGANGEGPNGKRQVYDWDRFKKLVKKLSPNTVVFTDIGPHIRWVGNENGIVNATNWNTLDTVGFTPGAGAPSSEILNTGNKDGKAWIPAECDVSIRPGWFFHKEEDHKVKTPQQLFELYLKSVGRGATLLLNVPPDRRGLFHENDSAALVGFRQLRERNFAKNLCSGALAGTSQLKEAGPLTDNDPNSFITLKDPKTETLRVHFKQPGSISCIVLREYIKDGQSVAKFRVKLKGNASEEEFSYTTIGHKRIISFPAREVTDISIDFPEALREVKIAGIEAYLIDAELVEASN